MVNGKSWNQALGDVVERPAGAFFAEKMTSLDILNMHFMNINNFWLVQSNLLNWYKKPSFAYKKKLNNYVDWYPDGKVNIFDNCITKNIKSGLGKKIGIYCVDKNKNINSYTYETIDKKVNSFSNLLISKLKNKKLSTCKVMIHASASIDSSVSMLSCAKLGIHFSVIFFLIV